MNIKIFLIALCFTAIGPPIGAAEYYVGKHGNDSSDGRSRQTAFLTVQKGVEALQPGDTLSIAPGEYSQSVRRDGLGSMEAQTTIKAELPGTVLLRGDVPIASSAFNIVDGYRFVYSADYDGPVQAISEVDTLRRMPVVASVGELEFLPGTSYYDAEKKRLYISTSDLQPPSAHRYTVSTIEGSGLLLLNPRRVTVDGIAATGFQSSRLLSYYPGHFTVWGIMLSNARGCILRNCVAYLNGGGLGYDSSNREKTDDNGWNLFDGCTAYANGSKFGGEGGNILGFQSNHDEMRNCYSFLGEPNGLRFYGAGIRGPAVMKNNLSWGSTYADAFIKGGQASKYGVAENTITLGIFHATNVKNSIVGTINQYNREPGKDTIYGLFSVWGNQQMKAAARDRNFADPQNLDFRLQATSEYRRAGPDGTDRGAFPYQPNIFYVSKAGSDNNDGLSTKNSWKTLARAMARLRPGDTLYLEGGTYDAAASLNVANDVGQTTSLRARGDEVVLIHGDFNVKKSRGLDFQRLNFTGKVELEESRRINFNNCRFGSESTPLQAEDVQELNITHCEFIATKHPALNLQKCDEVWLSGNIYNNRHAPALHLDKVKAVKYSDYNSYANPDAVWSVANSAVSFAALQNQHDKYSVLQTPDYATALLLSRLQNASAFGVGGPNGTALGFYRAYQQRPMTVTPPRIHSITDTTANIEWWTSVPAQTELAWGETPQTVNKVVINEGAQNVAAGFNTFSLSGLKRGTKYYFRLLTAEPADQHVAQYRSPAQPSETPIVIETARVATAARVLHVAPDGNDRRSGLSRTQAWRTVAHAADEARAGDTVIIAGGTYTESIRVRATGSEDRPITFTAAPGEKVIFDGNRRLISTAFSIAGKQHIRLDGLYFQQFGSGGWKSVVDITQSQQIQITRCFFNGFGAGISGTQLRAEHSTNVTVRNSVFSHGFNGMYFVATSNLDIENNVFLNNLISPILAAGGEPGSIRVKKNIFVDSIPSKVAVHLFELGGFEQYIFDVNAFYLRIPDEERKPFFFYGTGPGRISVAEYDAKAGTKNLIVADPQFRITSGQEPPIRAGKKIEFLGDWIPSQPDLDFDDLFTNNPELNARGIGLLPRAFGSFADKN